MDQERVAQLEKLGMVWSHFDVAWAEGLAAAHGWAAENGHLLAPLDAAYQGEPVGIWLKNARAIEVVEFFSYGDPHAYHFEPTVNPWVDKLPEDVAFRKVPAMFGGQFDAHGQAFLTLEAMEADPKVHAVAFDGIQNQRKRLTSAQEQAEFFATQGVDEGRYLNTFNSFAIRAQITQAKELAKKYEITEVPSIVVYGKYRFGLNTAGGPDGMLAVADHLIAKERAAHQVA